MPRTEPEGRRPSSAAVGIRWVSAFIDQPPSVFDRGTRFWQDVTDSALSPVRGGQGQFATLLPPDGDPYLRVQRRHDEGPRIHIDLHVDSVHDAGQHARSVGATVLGDFGHLVMSSPAELPFCLVSHGGESVRPTPVGNEHPHVVDQVSIDVPSPLFDQEAEFWQSLTGWELRTGGLDEFMFLVRPAGMPIRLLLQRLGPEDTSETARAHLDLACGSHVDDVVADHQRLGAVLVARYPFWAVMRDPVGLDYCLTGRDQLTGRLDLTPGSVSDD